MTTSKRDHMDYYFVVICTRGFSVSYNPDCSFMMALVSELDTVVVGAAF